MSDDEFLWIEKYRPKTVSDTILPENLKKTFQSYVEQGEIPNLILSGSSGVGKTTVAKAMIDELDCDHMLINGSLRGNIDTLRNDIHSFASTVSLMTDRRKYVILDEADYLNAQSTQPALRNFMEEYASNCGFVLTCNTPSRIIKPLQSRCSLIEFRIPNKIKPQLAGEFFKRLQWILEQEGVEYDKKVLAQLVQTHFPDWRRVLNEVQRYAPVGKIDSGILADQNRGKLSDLIGHLKEKDFKEARKWVAHNIDSNPESFFRELYETAYDYVKDSSVPNLVLIVADYQYKASFVADQEVNTMACLTEIMMSVEFR